VLRQLLATPRKTLGALAYDFDAANAYQPAYRHIATAIGLEKGAFLDMGCGPGWLAIYVASGRPELDAIGIDTSSAMVELAERNKGVRLNVTFREMSATQVIYPERTFDAVAVVHAKEIWAEAPAVLSEIHRLLVPAGRAFVYEPDADADIPAGWIQRRGAWPPKAMLQKVWRNATLDGARWDALKSAVKDSSFKGGEEGRHGYFRRLVLTK
jgi:ubiquinone/menaquinone biosynthesis C-methylase UbiE